MNTLYLQEMGMDDPETIRTDLTNHRIRTIENVDITYKGEKFNMFFEFTEGRHWKVRTTNKRNGKPLKYSVVETLVENGLFIDTQYERKEERNGRTLETSYRNLQLEKEFFKKHLKYTRNNVLKVVNKYAEIKFDRLVLVEEEATRIINNIGGYREKEILSTDPVFEIGETWNELHKIVRVSKREKIQYDGYSKIEITGSCEVDLVTGKITG